MDKKLEREGSQQKIAGIQMYMQGNQQAKRRNIKMQQGVNQTTNGTRIEAKAANFNQDINMGGSCANTNFN